MLDKKTVAVLKALNKLSVDNTYKVVTSDEIIASLNQKSQYDYDFIKSTMEFLEKQEYIIIKFSEENTYCYSLCPKARIFLEQLSSKGEQNRKGLGLMSYVYVMIASFIGSLLAMLIFFYSTF